MTAAVWLIIIVGAFAILQSRYYAKVSFKKLRYERTISKSAVFEGENLDLVEVIANNKLTPLPWLRVESKLSPWLRFRSQENLEILDDRFHRSRPVRRSTRIVPGSLSILLFLDRMNCRRTLFAGRVTFPFIAGFFPILS